MGQNQSIRQFGTGLSPSQPHVVSVAVEGNIGSGKSSLLNYLKNNPNIQIVPVSYNILLF